jgi:hypothetical protein
LELVEAGASVTLVRANERQSNKTEKSITYLIETIAGRRAEPEMILSISGQGGIGLLLGNRFFKENNPNIRYLKVKNARYGVYQ